MKTRDIQDEIIRLKKENGFFILAHSYETSDVIEIADCVGDSYKLSAAARSVPQENVLLCGVRFMAETAKILSPEKHVFLSRAEAGCPMAEQMKKEDVELYRREHPDHAVVAYINTTASLKTVCDVCVTSSLAVKIVQRMPEKNIFFIPDRNLGGYVKKRCPEKNVFLFDGGCPIHGKITPEEAFEAKKKHPGALLLVHPECVKEITDIADFVGSTAEILKFAENSDAKSFIIGTENAIASQLRASFPEKEFFELSKNMICPDMKLTTLTDVLDCVSGKKREEIVLPAQVIEKARGSIEKMLFYGG